MAVFGTILHLAITYAEQDVLEKLLSINYLDRSDIQRLLMARNEHNQTCLQYAASLEKKCLLLFLKKYLLAHVDVTHQNTILAASAMTPEL